MGRITHHQFRQLALRVHDVLSDVPLADAWVVRLPRTRAGVTLNEFLRATNGKLVRPSPIVDALLRLRFLIGSLFGWDDESPHVHETFSDRLSAADRQASLAPVCASHGRFRIIYRFENEQLEEILNKTAHAALLTALVEEVDCYHFFMGVYVRSVGPLTPLYMALIAPFRRLVVYPSLLRSVRANWIRTIAKM
jgi:hypothetical protein